MSKSLDLTNQQALLTKALHHKGWLKKKSPNLLGQWQDRYFMIINNGQQFAYCEDDKISSKIKGAIEIASITDIKKQDKISFKVIFPGRDFELKSKKPEECDEWIQLLNIAKNHAIQEIKQVGRKSSVASTIKMERQRTMSESKAWKDIDAQVFQKIQAEREVVMENQENENNSSDEDKNKNKAKQKETKVYENHTILDKLGLSTYLNQLNKEFIENRMCFGYIGKRSKGKIKYFQKRWFILVSAKPLHPEQYNDEKILDDSKLPPWLELETVYYYDNFDSGDTKSKGEIKMLENQDITHKDMQGSKESGFSFKINQGDRLFHLMADSESDRIRWTTALNNSKITAKETNNSMKIKIIRNVDPILKLYDQQQSLISKREKLREKIDLDFQLMKDEMGNNSYEDSLDNLLKFIPLVTKGMLDIFNGCIVKDPQRKDIIKEYIDYLHERICDIITLFWDRNHANIDSLSLLKLSSWFSQYREQLKDFFQDDRLLQSIRTLLSIYINRSVESVESVIQGIVEYERNCVPFVNENEQLITQAPIDLYKIINEGFDLAYKMCANKETVLKLGYFGKQIVQQYQTGVEELIDEAPLKIQQYVALCNNTIQLSNFTKQYCQRLKSYNFSDEDIDKCFDSQKIMKKFINISTIAKDKFFYFYFGTTQKYFKIFYLNIKLDEILKQLITPAQDLIVQLHDSFSRKIWKQVLDMIVLYYFNCFIVSCNKAKKEHLDDFLNKLQSDQQLLKGEFEEFLFESQLSQSLKVYDDMQEFLQQESISILQPCKNLRIFFGRAFNEKTLKNIMAIRHDMSKEQRKDTIDACQDLLEDYNKHAVDEEDKGRFMDVLGQDDDEQEEEEKKQNEVENENRRQDITLDDFDDDQEGVMIDQVKEHAEEEQKIEFIEEGLLYKKKPKEKDFLNVLVSNPIKNLVKNWDHRYVRIRKGHLFWYINSRSREAQNKLDLNKVDDVIAHQTKDTQFQLLLDGGKKYKFKADTKMQRDIWVRSIIKEQNKQELTSQQKIEAIKTGEGKKAIIKDYDELARKERQRQKAEERRRKRQEREMELKRRITEQKKQQQQEMEALQNIKMETTVSSQNTTVYTKDTLEIDRGVKNSIYQFVKYIYKNKAKEIYDMYVVVFFVYWFGGWMK